MTSAQPMPHTVATCPQCQTGNLGLERVVYARWYGAHFVTIPNFPSWVCDVCGSVEYDDAALEQVRLVLGREAGTAAEATRRAGANWAPFQSQPRTTGRRPI